MKDVFPLADPAMYGEILGDGLPDSKGDRLIDCKLDSRDFLLDLICKLRPSPERDDLSKLQILASKVNRTTSLYQFNAWNRLCLDDLIHLCDEPDGFELLVMPWNETRAPLHGRRLIIVGLTSDDLLHIRSFDENGTRTDVYEKRNGAVHVVTEIDGKEQTTPATSLEPIPQGSDSKTSNAKTNDSKANDSKSSDPKSGESKVTSQRDKAVEALKKILLDTSSIADLKPSNKREVVKNLSLIANREIVLNPGEEEDDDDDLLDTSPDPDLKIDTMSNPEISPGLITLPH
jgi:hypothetical protein